MAKRFTDSEKWSKPFIRCMKAPYKLLWLYILDECNHAGIWQVDMEVAEIKIGEKLKQETAIEFFGPKIIIIDRGEKWFIPDFIDFQYGTLNSENRAHNSVISILSKYSLIDSETGKIKEHLSPLQGAKDKDMDKDKVKDKDMDKEIQAELITEFEILQPEKSVLQTAIEKKYPNICKLKNQLTFEQAERLIAEFPKDKIKSILEAMENYKDLPKKYTSVNLTMRKWLSREMVKGKGTSKAEVIMNNAAEAIRNIKTDNHS